MFEIVRNETPECLNKLSGSADIKVVAVIKKATPPDKLYSQIKVGR